MAKATSQGRIFKSAHSLPQLATFQEAFPMLDSVSAEVSEFGEGNAGLGLRRFHKNSIREYVNCSNVHCLGRGLAMGDLLRQMLREARDEAEFDRPCDSRDESGASCPNHFGVRIRLRRVSVVRMTP